MNKDKIKKALRCCKEQACCDCPHWCEMGCRYQTLSDALDLITEQENEIDRLKDASNRLKQVIHDDVFDQLCHDCAESAVSVFEEIDELIKEVKK